jgi:basic membrane lipoprotein Med (substrate-binding protein (PBP1-ABC) superfamily)
LKSFKKHFEEYQQNPNPEIKIPKDGKVIDSVEIKFLQPRMMTNSEIQRNYELAYFYGVDLVILNGFMHINPLNDLMNSKVYFPKMKFVMNDGLVIGKTSNEDVTFITYRAEESGFMAGIITAIFMADQELTKVSTFGGMEIPPVVSYMYGFYQAFKLLQTHPILIENILTNANKFDKERIKKIKNNLTEKKISFVKLPKQFSDSFEAGHGKAISEELIIGKEVQVIFPVAGPQTGDSLEVINQKKYDDRYIIGVDTDQTQKYPSHKSKFIISAVKKIDFAIENKI